MPDDQPGNADIGLPVTLRLSDHTAEPTDLTILPSDRGVAVFCDAQDRVLAIAVSADVRRLARRRLAPPSEPREQAPSRSPDWRSLTRAIHARACGSQFEADVEWLRLAQRLLPHAAAAAADRWQGWFVHVDPDATHPWFTKTRHPGTPPSGRAGAYLGPLPDKHAAGRFIDAVNAVFDLCRYRHILVQTPDANACAYKEMHRCPAPCDGSIAMDAYREQVRCAIAFASHPPEQWIDAQQQEMDACAASQDFERAALIKRQIDDARAITGSKYAWLTAPGAFSFVAVQQSTETERARIFLLHGGSIQQIADVAIKIEPADAKRTCQLLRDTAKYRTDLATLAQPEHEMLGLMCYHLFLPARKQRGAWARLTDVTPERLRALIEHAHHRWAKLDKPGKDDLMPDADDDRLIESVDAPH